MIVIDVRGAISKCAKAEPLTHGMVGQQAKFQFDHVWKNLAVQAFAASGEKSYPLVIRLDNTVVIPHELMKEGNVVLLGVRGLNYDGTVRIPTTWASIGIVKASVDGKNEYEPQPDPTPSEIEQLLILSEEVRRIAQSVRDDADAGKFNGEKGEKGDPGAVDPDAVSAAVADYLHNHPINIPIESVNGKTGKVTLNAADVGALPADTQIPTVPTKISAFQNDAGYALKSEIPAPYNDSELWQVINGKQDAITDLTAIRSGAASGATALRPGDISDWAKQPNKPSYTSTEVGAEQAAAIRTNGEMVMFGLNGRLTASGIKANDIATKADIVNAIAAVDEIADDIASATENVLEVL